MTNKNFYKWDIHTHSGVSSLCSYEDPKNLVIAATRRGLSGFCITDHCPPYGRSVIPGFYLDTRQLAKEKGIHLILGREIKLTLDGKTNDFLIFHPNERAVFDYDIKFEDMSPRFVDEFRASGGILILAHPWDEPNENLPIDAIETQNIRYGGEEFRCKTEFSRALPHTGGSDAHIFNDVGLCYTAFESRIENSLDLIREIKKNKCRPAASKRLFQGDI